MTKSLFLFCASNGKLLLVGDKEFMTCFISYISGQMPVRKFEYFSLLICQRMRSDPFSFVLLTVYLLFYLGTETSEDTLREGGHLRGDFF